MLADIRKKRLNGPLADLAVSGYLDCEMFVRQMLETATRKRVKGSAGSKKGGSDTLCPVY